MADSKEALDPQKRWIGFGAAALVAALLVWRCSKTSSDHPSGGAGGSESPEMGSSSESDVPSGADGLSAPIAASHIGADVIVAGLDVAAKAIRVQRIDSKDKVVAEKLALRDVAWSTDSDLKLVAAPEGVALTWRGLRAGKLIRQLVVLDAKLEPKGEPTDVSAASCATRDAVWFSDGSHASSRPWTGSPTRVSLPKEKDASLLCGQHRAFAVLDDEDKTSALVLGGEAGSPVTMIRENDFGEDEQRELAEYTVGDDVGFVRLAASGALAIRELTGDGAGALHRLKSTIGKDDDVVAVDASPRIVVILFTQDVSEAAKDAATSDTTNCTRISALRVDRQSFEESTTELSPGRCGYEVGPFFTSAVGEDVAVAWTERTGGLGRARAPIASLAQARVTPASAAVGVKRIDQAADALVDAGCDTSSCFAVALARREGADAMAPGYAKVLRYK